MANEGSLNLFSGEKDCKNIVSEYGDKDFETNNGKNFFRESKQSGKQGFVLFYGRFCPYCRKYAPIYEHLQKWVDLTSINGKKVSDYFTIAAVNGMKHREITNKAKIEAYPTLLFSNILGELSEAKRGVISMFSTSGPVNEIHFILDSVSQLMGLSSEELSREKAKYTLSRDLQLKSQPKPQPKRGGFNFTFGRR